MPEPAKRRYDTTKRRERAQETRARIARSARALFEEHGYSATTIQAIAKGADVAADTVFEIWGSKARLFEALVVEIEQTGSAAPILERMRATSPADAPDEMLRIVAALGRDLAGRLLWATEAMRKGGLADPHLAASWAAGDTRRRAEMKRLVSALSKAGRLRAGLDVRDATTVLWTLTSPDIYRMLVVDSRWSPTRYERWLGEALARELLGADFAG